MSVGDVITCVFAVAFTLGALLLPFAIGGWMRTQTPNRKAAGALYALFGTLGLAIFGIGSTGSLLTSLGVAESTFWYFFLGQTVAIAVNFYFWILRGARS